MTIKKFKIQIITKTGLHIGSGNAKVEIWWMDQPVIKDREWMPYIPASSLKGKLRSLYEVSMWNEIKRDGNWLVQFNGKDYDEVSMFFGKAGTEKNNLDNLWPTRFIFRDLTLKIGKVKEWLYGADKLLDIRKSGEPIFEEKTEVSIDRFTGIAASSGPRPLERVPAGTIFEWELIVRLFDKPSTEKEEANLAKFWENFEWLKELIENDYLGWQGSRWSGQVEINFIPDND